MSKLNISPKVKLGCEAFLDGAAKNLSGRRIGFITNHTGLTGDLKPLIHEFLDHGLKITALYGPEHGIRGEVADGVKVANGLYKDTRIPVYSLYADTRKPSTEMLKDVDILLFDIQDVGARFYTFMWTMANALEAACEHHIPFYVLDRPNPIRGDIAEGPILNVEYRSFIGYYPVAQRHGMTVGEMARFVSATYDKGEKVLTVIPCEGWKRDMWFDQTGLQFVMPSPGMPTLNTATVYTGACLFEGTNVSEGRGTTRPFEVFGASWIDPDRLADEANQLNLPGVLFRALYFQPTFSKYKDEACGGVQIHVVDRNAFQAVRTGLEMVCLVRRLYPDKFAFREPGPKGKCFFDLLTGSDKTRLAILSGASAKEISESWKDNLSEYIRMRAQYLLY